MFNHVSIIRKTKHHFANIPGWRSNRKFFVVESDDWGSIRMPSKNAYNELLKNGIRVDKCPYNNYDSLEGENDFAALFDTLDKFRDKNGRKPVITANVVLANPDFDKIKEDNYEKYHYKLVSNTLCANNGGRKILDLWKEALSEKYFFPQLHGREHLNVSHWLQALRENDYETQLAFNHGVFGHPSKWAQTHNTHFLSALEYFTEQELSVAVKSVEEGVQLFEELLGYKPASFIASRYIWDQHIEEVLKNNEVNLIQGTMIQLLPYLNRTSVKHKKKYHYLGQKNKLGQRYITRNCFFEPAAKPRFDWVSDCLQRTKTAFFWGKPVVLCSHRVNFIGKLNENNRKTNLSLLETLLNKVIKLFPDVEFITTAELGREILNS